MASFDNIYDLSESLDADGIDHFVYTIKRSDDAANESVHIFYQFATKENIDTFCFVMNDLVNNARDKLEVESPPPSDEKDSN